MIKLLFLISFLSFNCYACSDEIKILIQDEFGDDVKFLTCKNNPELTNQTIIAFVSNTKDDDSGISVNDAHTVLVENNKIITSLIEKGMINNDTIQLDDVEIDTGLYKITQSLRAIGVRYHFVGPSRVNPYSENVLNLYINEKNTLRNILYSLSMHEQSGEWDGNCNGYFDETTRYISIAKSSSYGFYDLFLTGKSAHSIAQAKKEDCSESTKTAKINKVKITFDGKKYKIPRDLNSDLLSPQNTTKF